MFFIILNIIKLTLRFLWPVFLANRDKSCSVYLSEVSSPLVAASSNVRGPLFLSQRPFLGFSLGMTVKGCWDLLGH